MAETLGYLVRQATPLDYEALTRLERQAFTELGSAFYALQDIECALEHFEGLSLRLIEEGHYFVMTDFQENLIAGGGWSRAELEYIASAAGDHGKNDTGVVRCVYVSPQHARRGLAQKVLRFLETDALSAGVRRLTLTASKTAEALYLRAGYTPDPYYDVRLPNGRILLLRPMQKNLISAPA
jgi:GNAT superfamily N-acetyltransferase